MADADGVAETAQRAGGTAVMEPTDVMDAGRMAVLQDTEGVSISVWQPGTHKGAELVNEPGAMSWNELNSRDIQGAKAFYRAVSGWNSVTHGEGPGAYTEFQFGGRNIAGLMQMPPMIPAEVPPSWMVYFTVQDTDAAIAKATDLGGSVQVSPMDIEPGRFSVLSDPQRARFAVIRLHDPYG